MARNNRASTGSSGRGVRFSEDNGQPAGIDVDLMRAAVADQADVQHHHHHQQPSDGSPFAPGYSVAAARPSNASSVSRDVGPFERVDDDEQHFRIGSSRDDDRSETASEVSEGHIDVEEDVLEYRPSKERRPTGTFVASDFRKAAEQGRDVHDSPGVGANGLGVSAEKPPSPIGSTPFMNPFGQQQQQASSSSSRNIHGLELPARPQPSANLPQQGMTARPVSGSYAPPYGPPPNAPPFPSSPRGMMSPMAGGAGPFSPHVQHYDPLSSPSMVQPFSPRVTASGSVKSPLLKPALTRREQEQHMDPMRPNMSGDSLERATTPAEAVRQAHMNADPTTAAGIGGAGAAAGAGGGGIAKTLVGLYGAFNGNATPGQGVSGPTFHVHRDSDDSDNATLTPDSPVKGKDADLPYTAPPPRPTNLRRDSTIYADDAMDENDPRLTGMLRRSVQIKRERQQQNAFDHRRSSWSSETGDPMVPKRPANRRRLSLGNMHIDFGGDDDDDGSDRYTPRRKSFDRRKSATTIQYHISHVQQRQKFILKLSKALMMFGAPSHRIESQLNATAAVLEVDAQFVHFPGIVIAAFGDIDKHTSETHFVKSSGALVLGQLHEVHTIYRRVVHDECSVDEGTEELSKLIRQKPIYGVWTRILIAGGLCFIIAPLSFGGSFVDAWASACFGILLKFLDLRVAKNNAMYSNIFEITVAILISFISRGLSTTNVFCYQAIASSGVVMVLPGYVILCGSLELASKNMIAGSVRMVYAIIYSLFLGFGIAIGSDLYFLLDPAARQSMYVPLTQATEVSGSFSLANSTMPIWNGTFSFTNGTDDGTSSLKLGNINCERLPDDPWWKSGVSAWFNFLFVPLFSLLLCLHNLQPWKSKELIVMITIACIGFAANLLANHFIFSRSDVVSAIGSFIIGILGNAYSRIFRGTAFTAMAVAVLFLVPSGMAMAGGLAMTYKGSDGDLYSNGLSIGFRMVAVSIGISVGLFGSGLVVYSFGRKKGAALFAF